MSSLGTDLPKEMSRVRDVLMPQYLSIGPAGGFALAMMRAELDAAARLHFPAQRDHPPLQVSEQQLELLHLRAPRR